MNARRHLDPGVWLSCKTLSPGEELPWHDHGMATACVVYAGRVDEEDARVRRIRRPSDVVIRRQPERHRNRAGESGVRILTLEIGSDAMVELRREGLRGSGTSAFSSPGAARIARLAHAELRHQAAASGLRLQGLVYDLLATTVRCERDRATSTAWLQAVADELRENPRETLDLRAMAHRHGVSAYRLSRAFRGRHGTSIAEYLRRVRVDRATELLAREGPSLTEIAFDCGFYDQSHLTNVFKQQTGLTPGEYRRRVGASG